MRVVAGFYPLYDVAQRVGGARVSASNLTPPGVEPHDFELTTSDVDRVASAQLVLYLGGGFQPALERVVRREGPEAVDLLGELSAPGGQGDPHVWLDPLSMAAMTKTVEERLVSLDPGGESLYREGGMRYRTELEALHADFESGLRTCARRLLVTSHSAFGHLARRYGLEQVSLAGLSPEIEPDPRRLAEIADLVRRQGVTTVFSESLASPRVAQTLARETGARAKVLDPLEGLSRQRLNDGASYFSVMRENLTTLVDALGCSGPDEPASG
ncbi:MAG: metal ABC transporter substrate-binding protein [Acidimicrobiia bacterium]